MLCVFGVSFAEDTATSNPVTGVSLSPSNVTIGVGQITNLFSSISPYNADNRNLIWTSDAENIVTVQNGSSGNGIITGVGVGTAHITVKTEDGGFEASSEVIVIEPELDDSWTYAKLTSTDQLALLSQSSIDSYWFGRHDLPSDISVGSKVVYAYNSENEYYSVTYVKSKDDTPYWGGSGDGFSLSAIQECIDAGDLIYIVYEINNPAYDWTYTTSEDGTVVTLTAYTGTSTDVVIPANGDFGENVKEVHIGKDVMKAAASNAVSLSISENGDKVIADGNNWGQLFESNNSLVNLDLSRLNTEGITSLYYLFGWNGSSSILNVKFSGCDLENSTGQMAIFYKCSSLKTVDLSNVKLGATCSLFTDCPLLETVDFSNADTTNITNLFDMFYGCSSLKELDLSSFDTSNVTSMTSMFYGCSALKKLDLSSFDTSNVTAMAYMFKECSALEELDLSCFDTKNLQNTGDMFSGCTNLKTITVGSKWNLSDYTSSTNMFSGCTSLVGGKGTVYDSTHLNKDYAVADCGPDSVCPGYLTYKSTQIVNSVFLPKRVTLNAGNCTKIITAVVFTDTTPNGGVYWTYDDPDNCLYHPNIDAANQNFGTTSNINIYLTPLKAGTVTVTATPRDDESKAVSCTVNILPTGDIDENGEVNTNDAAVAKEVAIKVTEATALSEEALTAADLDGNGVITINEARKIKRAALGEITLD